MMITTGLSSPPGQSRAHLSLHMPSIGDSQAHAARVSVVIPVYNEARNLAELMDRCVRSCNQLAQGFELILVDDGSDDGSAEMISNAALSSGGKIVGVILDRNYGQHAAVMAGFSEAQGEIIVTLDADLQNPPEEIPNLVRKAEQGYDVVGSVRTLRRDSSLRRVGSFLTNFVLRRVTDVVMNDIGCMLRAYHRSVVDTMVQSGSGSSFIPILANEIARRPTEINVTHCVRRSGESKYGVWKLINLQFKLLTELTTLPLRMVGIVSIVLCAIAAGFGLGIGSSGIEWSRLGRPAILSVLFALISAQSIGIAFLAAYVAQWRRNGQRRPTSICRRIVGRPSAGSLHQTVGPTETCR